MNLKNPLAAALLMTASAAMSQTLVLPTSSGFGPQTAPFSPTLPGDTDMVEKCSTVPYRLCTTQELNFREIRKGGGCAEKDFACQRKLMENTGSAPLQLLGNQSNPSTANDEFFKKCGTVPYRLCTSDEQKKRDAWLASKKPENKKPSADPKGEPTTVDEIVVTGRRYDQEPGFIGPPAPPDRPSAPPAMTDAQFKAGFEVVQNTYPDAIDLGDHRYGLPKKDGTIEVCSQGGCETRPQSEFSDQIQQANAERRNYTGSSGGGMSMTSTPNTAPKGTGGAVAGNDPAGDTPPTTPTGNGGSRSPGRDQGAEVFANQESMGGGDSGSGAGSSGQGDVAMAGKDQVIKIDGAVAKAEAAKSGYSYTRIGQAAENSKALINGGAATFGPTPAANGRLAEPPVGDGTQLGKIQSAANR